MRKNIAHVGHMGSIFKILQIGAHEKCLKSFGRRPEA